MKILWLTNIPSPYRVDFFNELGKQCELTVLFEKEASDERDGSWKKFNTDYFMPIFLKGKNVGVAEAFCPEVIRYLNRNAYDHIVVTNFSDITGMLAIAVMRLKRISYLIESDGGFAGSGRGIKERIKRWLLSGADYYFSTANVHDEYYMKYGAKKSELVRYPFTSLHDRDILNEPVSEEKKKLLRKKLGMQEKKIILAVGQYIPRKGYDLLINAMIQMEEAGCYIVGGKPPQEYIDIVDSFGVENVHFVDFKIKRELTEYYMAADVFVHPTREDIWGLVINEAMAKGLPIVTTNRCVSGLELVRSETIGKIVPINRVDLLTKAMKETLASTGRKTSIAVLEAIREYTIEKMACRHIEVLEGQGIERKVNR